MSRSKIEGYLDTYPEDGEIPDAPEPANSTRNTLKAERNAKWGGESGGPFNDADYGKVRKFPSHT